jgi:DNA-binding NtrC family response regulator
MPDSNKTLQSFVDSRFTLNQMESKYIVEILTLVDGNRKEAAKILDIAEKTLYDKIKKYGIRAKYFLSTT